MSAQDLTSAALALPSNVNPYTFLADTLHDSIFLPFSQNYKNNLRAIQALAGLGLILILLTLSLKIRQKSFSIFNVKRLKRGRLIVPNTTITYCLLTLVYFTLALAHTENIIYAYYGQSDLHKEVQHLVIYNSMAILVYFPLTVAFICEAWGMAGSIYLHKSSMGQIGPEGCVKPWYINALFIGMVCYDVGMNTLVAPVVVRLRNIMYDYYTPLVSALLAAATDWKEGDTFTPPDQLPFWCNGLLHESASYEYWTKVSVWNIFGFNVILFALVFTISILLYRMLQSQLNSSSLNPRSTSVLKIISRILTLECISVAISSFIFGFYIDAYTATSFVQLSTDAGANSRINLIALYTYGTLGIPVHSIILYRTIMAFPLARNNQPTTSSNRSYPGLRFLPNFSILDRQFQSRKGGSSLGIGIQRNNTVEVNKVEEGKPIALVLISDLNHTSISSLAPTTAHYESGEKAYVDESASEGNYSATNKAETV